eukprot:Pgem_evm1s1128
MLGAGVLEVPDALNKCGWVLGSIVLTVMTCASIYGGLMLAKLRGEKAYIRSYGDLVYHVLYERFTSERVAKLGRLCTNSIGYVYLFGAITIYLITAMESFSKVFHFWNLSPTEWIIASAVCLLPLIQIRSLHEASFVSVIGVATIVVVNVMLLVRLITGVVNRSASASEIVEYDGQTFSSIINGITSMTFAYGGHVIMVEIMSEMKKPKDFSKSVMSSQLFMFANYAIIGVSGYYVYGNKVKSPIIGNFPDDDIQSKIMNFCLFVHVLIAYCINSQVVCQALVSTVFPNTFGVDPEGNDEKPRGMMLKQAFYWGASSTVILCISTGMAILIPIMSDMMSIFSCLGIFTLSFAVPSMLYICYLETKLRLSGYASVDNMEEEGSVDSLTLDNNEQRFRSLGKRITKIFVGLNWIYVICSLSLCGVGLYMAIDNVIHPTKM